MQLTTVKELFKEREKYLDKEITVGGFQGVRLYRIKRWYKL